jgi:C_GCAxxG_C_C family probable redox protein
MTIEEEARSNFNSGYNCAESVLLVVTKRAGPPVERSQSYIPRIATGFGGGIARNGDVCGALIGGAMAISLTTGRNNPDQDREPCYTAVDRFYSEFMKRFGSCRCRDLTGLDLKNPEQRQIYQTRVHGRQCNPIVARAARKACDILNES